MAKKAIKKAAKKPAKKTTKREAKQLERALSIRFYGVLRTDPWGGQRLSPYVFETLTDARNYVKLIKTSVSRAKTVRLIARMAE